MNPQTLTSTCLSGDQDSVRASQVAQVLKSPFVLWCDAHAPDEERDELSAFREMLFEKGDAHEEQVIESAFPDAQQLVYETPEQGFGFVLEQCFSGVDCVAQAPLFYRPEGLEGRPDVIEKVPGSSVFGDYHYVVKEIKYAKNIKDHHRLQAAFYNYLLGRIQGFTPACFTLINNEHEEFVCDYADYEQQLLDAIEQARQVLAREEPPLPVYGEGEPWTSYSQRIAQDNQDVSLLYGLGRSVRERLHAIGVYTLDDLRAADKETLLSVKGVGAGTYNKWVQHLRAFEQGEPVKLEEPRLPEAEREIFFDIEGDTELGVDYLYGLLEDGEFTAFWADGPDDEQRMWERFLAYVDALDDAAIYYYAPYEKQSIRRMRKRYGCPDELYEKLQSMLVDLFPVVKRCFALPLTSYSIKPVASYLGFEWRAQDAGGANSMQWYRSYLDGQQELKQKILDYNEDDVRATQVLLDWLQKA